MNRSVCSRSRAFQVVRSRSPFCASLILGALSVACGSETPASNSPGNGSGGTSNSSGGSASTTGGSTNGTSGNSSSTGGSNTNTGGTSNNGGATFASATLYQTSKSGERLVESTLTLADKGSNSAPEIAVSGTTRQEILGFGASLTESSAYVLSKVEPSVRSQILKELFAPHPEGANYTLTRVHMGSCDFSLPEALGGKRYTYAPTQTADLSNFSVAEDEPDLIPLIKDARAASGGVLKVMSSPWTPPPWMKTGAKDEGGFVGGNFNASHSALYAQYFVKYIQAYEAAGIPIWAVTPQNEPEHCGEFETACMPAGTMASFVGQHLGPALEAAGYGDVLILGFDHNKGPSLVKYAQAMYNNTQADQYTDGMAHHWYGSTINFYDDSLRQTHDLRPEKFIIGTEQSLDSFDFPAEQWFSVDKWWWDVNAKDWCTGQSWCAEQSLHPRYKAVYRYAQDLILSLNNWQNAWISWNSVLDQKGGPNWFGVTCSADVMINTDTKAVYQPPTFTATQHFSRFMLPGGRVLESSVGQTGLMAVAAKNPDNSVAVVVLNMKAEPVSYQLTVGDSAVEVQIPGDALQTVVLR